MLQFEEKNGSLHPICAAESGIGRGMVPRTPRGRRERSCRRGEVRHRGKGREPEERAGIAGKKERRGKGRMPRKRSDAAEKIRCRRKGGRRGEIGHRRKGRAPCREEGSVLRDEGVGNGTLVARRGGGVDIKGRNACRAQRRLPHAVVAPSTTRAEVTSRPG